MIKNFQKEGCHVFAYDDIHDMIISGTIYNYHPEKNGQTKWVEICMDSGGITPILLLEHIFETKDDAVFFVQKLKQQKINTYLNEIGNSVKNLLIFAINHDINKEPAAKKAYTQKAHELLGINIEKDL